MWLRADGACGMPKLVSGRIPSARAQTLHESDGAELDSSEFRRWTVHHLAGRARACWLFGLGLCGATERRNVRGPGRWKGRM